MRQRAADRVIRRRVGRRKTPHPACDPQLPKAALHRLPTIRLAVRVDAVNSVKKVEGTGKLVLDRVDERLGQFLAEHSCEVLNRRPRIGSEFVMNEW